MNAEPGFSRAELELRLGPAVVAKARRLIAEAPPLRPELREQLRAVFASARAVQDVKPTPGADAA